MESRRNWLPPKFLPFQVPFDAAMSDTYYVRSQGKVLGPYSFEELKTKAGKGHLKKTHQISTDKRQWQSARRVEGLFPPAPKPPQREPAGPASPVREIELVDVNIIEDEPIGVDDETEWHYCLQGDAETQGPVSEAKLKRLFQSGRLPDDTLVWNENLTDWVEAGRIPTLQSAPARAAAEIPLIDTRSAYAEPDGDELPVPPLASASLILGILGIAIPVGVGSVLAIVFGHLALGQIKDNRRFYQGENMAKTGLIIGYVTLAILLVAASAWLIYQMGQG